MLSVSDQPPAPEPEVGWGGVRECAFFTWVFSGLLRPSRMLPGAWKVDMSQGRLFPGSRRA